MVLFEGGQLPGLKRTSLWGKFGDMLEENSPGNEGGVLVSVLLVLLVSPCDTVREVV